MRFVEEGGFKVDIVADGDLGSIIIEAVLLFA